MGLQATKGNKIMEVMSFVWLMILKRAILCTLFTTGKSVHTFFWGIFKGGIVIV